MIYSIIFFPSQSPFNDFSDKGTSAALKMNEKQSTSEMDVLSILFGTSTAFHKNIILCSWTRKTNIVCFADFYFFIFNLIFFSLNIHVCDRFLYQ